MKIKVKLLTLIISILLAISIVATVFIGFSLFTKQLEQERQILQSYKKTMHDTHAELFRFLMDDFIVKDQMKIFNKSMDSKNINFKKFKDIKNLPKISPEVETALGNILKLEDYQATAFKKFHNSVENMLIVAKKELGTDNRFVLNMFAISDANLKEKSIYRLKVSIDKAKKELYKLEFGMQTSIDIIDDQYAIIDDKVNTFKNMGNNITITLFLIVMILSVIISLIASGRIVSSIKKIGVSLSVMATGDLRREINIKTSDEIGVLGKGMDIFQNELSNSLNRIKNFSIKNEEIKDHLAINAAKTSVSSIQIGANIKSVDKQINSLNNNILESNQKVNNITSFIVDLNDYVSNQMIMIEESTASITEMIASIKSISNLTDRNKEVIEGLNETAKEGDNQITETTDLIEDINSSVQKIGAMAEVIQNISDQTNLLAMNAAIEAAHAGDAGKGFAVVADEIRKLSEESAVSSKDIGKNLKYIISKFDKASTSGANTREAFSNIYNSIKRVSGYLTDVSSSTFELNIGGQQILEAIDNLSNISMAVQNKSVEMTVNAESVKESIGQVSEFSTIVTQAMAEVDEGFNEIKESIADLGGISTQAGNISKNLNIEIKKFKTADIHNNVEKVKSEILV